MRTRSATAKSAPAAIRLPAPQTDGLRTVEAALYRRRSTRDFAPVPLGIEEAAQMAWAALGNTEGPRKTVPSAGAQYPLDLYVVAGDVERLNAGMYAYQPPAHTLAPILAGDHRGPLCRAALNQGLIQAAPLVLVITAVYERTTGRYGPRGQRYVLMEAGHAGQNIYLQAAALGLGTVAIAAFDDNEVKRVLRLPRYTEPLYLMPVGRLR